MSALSSQRFCLRWNNHQSNLLTVFDQLLHDESFVDVTLAVEGRFLKAHKMVLSACSPYFQALFVGHPDKHPIVILKDVPYCDMRSLLDFMYRGEVSVDQERLTAFLKVAESLRIKGLTEVNEERCDLPLITSSLLSSASIPPPLGVTAHTPPPHLHRIHPIPGQRRNLPVPSATPLLGSALTAPKRKRGRPRKLSGSSGVDGVTTGTKSGNEDADGSRFGSDSMATQGSPEMMDMKVPADFQSSDSPNGQRSCEENGTLPTDEHGDNLGQENEIQTKKIKQEQPEPAPGPSTQDPGQAFLQQSNTENDQYPQDPLSTTSNPLSTTSDPLSTPLLTPKTEIEHNQENFSGGSSEAGGGGSGNRPEGMNSLPVPAPPQARPPVKRRPRRRATSSSQDPAEQLTEMSVRGLNLFRYASISEGVYQCTECAKADIQKTFKNKYSFQRHAFLYHEGHQRKVFPCPVCAKEFSRPDKMKNHMKTVHECFMPKDCVFPLGFFLPP